MNKVVCTGIKRSEGIIRVTLLPPLFRQTHHMYSSKTQTTQHSSFQPYSMLVEMGKRRRDFTCVLTNDETSGIFSYLTQQDCMRCMQVSQRWGRLVPQYAETAFNSFRVDGRKDYSQQSKFYCLSWTTCQNSGCGWVP